MELYFSPFEIALPCALRSRRDVSFRGGAHKSFPLRGLLALIRQWRRRAYERRLLARFAEVERHDLAITPADIVAECAKPFWQP